LNSRIPDTAGPATYLYDGSFEGLLTVVFEAYAHKRWPQQIMAVNRAQPGLFGPTQLVSTDAAKADRVWQGLLRKISQTARTSLYRCYLSELPGVEMTLFAYLRQAFEGPEGMEQNFASVSVRQVARISQQVHREKHRMEAFVRFQRTVDGLFVSTIDPDFNVLPLISDHFRNRYADQRWVIYDTRRRYGIYFDLQEVMDVSFADSTIGSGNLPAHALAETEDTYQALWQAYFDHVNIPARKNLKLQLRQLLRRYWKYLPEKKPRAV
jgi:probable DNA metabolism protein